MNSNHRSRRRFLRQTLALTATTVGASTSWIRAETASKTNASVIEIGSRRELLVDDYLITSMDGVQLKMHRPEARDVAIVCDKPWEGNTSAYYTLFRDEDRYRMYYRGAHFDEQTKKEAHPEFACYAESKDGLKWEKPELGLFEFNGSKKNNIIWTGAGTHNFTPFKDNNPNCAADARYKAMARAITKTSGKPKGCLHAYKSADGVRWSLLEEAVILDGAFDSQNLALWDDARGEYRAYWRIFTDKRRAIRTATSKDFIKWDNHADLKYEDSPAEDLYTNAIQPYFRAPHLFIGFPTRFQPKTQQVEPVLMTSRDGVLFRRWSEELIPITAPKDRDGNRSNYMTHSLVQVPGNEREVSVYATEAYYKGPGSRVRRFVFRTDGFVSADAGAAGGALTSKMISFKGSKLSLNIASKGFTRVELQSADGKALPGFALDDCDPIAADSIEHVVNWKGGSLATLAGKPVRLRFDLKDASLYSFQFTE